MVQSVLLPSISPELHSLDASHREYPGFCSVRALLSMYSELATSIRCCCSLYLYTHTAETHDILYAYGWIQGDAAQEE